MGGSPQAEVEQDLADNLTIIRTALGNPTAQVPFFRAANGSWGATPTRTRPSRSACSRSP